VSVDFNSSTQNGSPHKLGKLSVKQWIM